MNNQINEDAKVINLHHFRKSQSLTEKSHSTQEADEFGDRMQRIRSSLEKINDAMADLMGTNPLNNQNINSQATRQQVNGDRTAKELEARRERMENCHHCHHHTDDFHIGKKIGWALFLIIATCYLSFNVFS